METTETTANFKQYLMRRYGDRSTPKHYLSDLHVFSLHLGAKSTLEATKADIDSFVDEQRKRGLAPTTINRRLATLHTFFEYTAGQSPDDARPNPVNWRQHRVKEGHPLPRDVADTDVERLFDVVDNERDAAMFGLMVGAGLRVEEVAQLRLGNLGTARPETQMVQLRVRGKGNKERMVWLTPRWHAMLNAWLAIRPQAKDDHLFLNQHQRGITKDGIQYWLGRYTATAGVTITCHQLRHTFARRLADQRMPIESISKLLGHAFVTTTQRYTLGADPNLREAFQVAMAQIDSTAAEQPADRVTVPHQRSLRQSEHADPAKLSQELSRFDALPSWLHDELQTYAEMRWYTWKPHMAARYMTRLTCQQFNIWTWLLAYRPLTGWADLKRSDVESWLDARRTAGLSVISCYTELCDLRAFLKSVEDRGRPVNPAIFRIPAPNLADPLPRHLTDEQYQRLVKTVWAATATEQLAARAARAWFLTLAHTGMRLNEMLDLRLSDIDFANHRIMICNPKNNHDRIAFMTPVLAQVLQHYLALRQPTPDDHLWFYDDRLLADEPVRNQVQRWGKQCNVVVTPHQLRHTFATQLINQGMPMESVRKLLGHKTLNMTQHYARIYDATVQQQFEMAAAALEGILVQDWPIPVLLPHPVSV